MIAETFEDKTIYPEYEKVESLKLELLLSKETISVTDMGAGSKTEKGSVRDIRKIAKNSSKQKKFGRLLFRLARGLKPFEVLELGTSLGLSTAYLALGNPESNVTSIEGCPNISAKANGHLKSLGIQNSRLITGNFDDELPAYLNTVDQLDFVFFDGNHQKQSTINYFEQCLPKTVNDTVFVFDDIHWSEEMEAAWDHIRKHPATKLTIDIFAMGIVFFRKELTKQNFVIRF
ncbi:MAG: class I SAM-dependent methyltransferase [Bacteroidales bacterium]